MTFEEVRSLAESLGPLVSVATSASDGTPHVVPLVAHWDGDTMVFASRASSHKVRHLRSRNVVAVQAVTLGEPFPDALLLKGTAEVIDDHRREELWGGGLFPYLPQMFSGWDDPNLLFVRFTPHRAYFTPEGGRGATVSWHAGEGVHPAG